MADVELKTQLTLGGDKEYKSALKGINDQLKIAKSGMAAATSAFAKNDRSVEANAARREGLSKVLEEQQKKMKLVADEIEKLEAAEGDNTADVNKLKVQYNNLQAECNKTQRAIDELSDATEEESEASEDAAENTGKFGEKLSKAAVTAGKATFAAVAAGIAAVGAAAAAAMKDLTGFAVGASEYADEINTLSSQTGIAASTLQKWRYAEGLIDVSTDSMAGAMKKMTKYMKNAKDGSATAQEKFKALGVSILDSNGNLRDSEEVFYDAINALGKVGNETERNALAMEIFGNSATDLNPLIEQGTGTLQKLGDEASKTGYVLNAKMMRSLQNFNDQIERMKNAGVTLKNVIGATVAPTFTKLAWKATSSMSKVSKALEDGLQPGELDTLIESLEKDFSDMFNLILRKAVAYFPIFIKLVSATISTIVRNMPTYLNTLLPAVTGLLQSLLTSLSEEAGPLATFALNLINSVATFLSTNLPTIASTALTVVSTLIDGITENLPTLFPLAISMMAQLGTYMVKAIPMLMTKIPYIVKAIKDSIKSIDWSGTTKKILTALGQSFIDTAAAIGDDLFKAFESIKIGIKKAFGIGLTEGEKSFGEQIGESIILDICQGLGNIGDAAFEAITDAANNLWDELRGALGLSSGRSGKSNSAGAGRGTTAKGVGRAYAESIAEGITQGSSTANTAAFNAGTGVSRNAGLALGVGRSSSTKGEEVGRYFSQGLSKGISNNSGAITAAAKAAAYKAYNAAKKALKIQSPSRVMMEIGGYYDEGFAVGIRKNAEKVYEAAQTLATESVMPNVSRTGAIAGAAASAASSGGSVINLNTTYSGPFSANDAGVFGQVLARNLSGACAVMG